MPHLDVPDRLFIDGQWTSAHDGDQLEVIDPATGTGFASVAAGGPTDATDAVAAAARALPAWADAAPRHRSEVLRQAFELMSDRREALAHLVVRENGKALADARAEIAYAAEFLRWYAEEAVRIDGRLGRAPAGTNHIVVTHQPVGVCLLVTPWNFPAAMVTRKLGPALAAGCAVVVKPASATPLTALALASILAEAGAPPGVVNVVVTQRTSEVVDAILDDPRVRKLSFTGSTEVGQVLLAGSARRVLNASMELGGNAPFLVLADADLAAAVDGALVAKMRNGGSACTAANRFYVHRSLAEAFRSCLASAMGSLRLGPGLDAATQVGPLIDERTRTKVAGLVDEAVDGGAKPLTGADVPPGPGYFYPPTVLDVPDPDATILAEEIFGPVAPIVTFDDLDDAIRLANRSEHGLAAYLYTADLAQGLRVAEQLEAGMVGLNRGVVSDPSAPFGGVKQSGLGREGGHEGLLEYLESKYIATDW